MSRARATAVLALAALTVGFAPSTARAVSSSSGSARASGCDRVERHGRITVPVTSQGSQRPVVVVLPSSYNGRHRLPLVLTLHGSGSGPDEQLRRSRLDQTGEKRGFAVAAPQGGIAAGANHSWNVPHVTSAPPGAPNDEQYLTDVIETLVQRLCLDPRRVFATGYSGGGRMVSQYACDGPGLLAGIAPVAGLRAGAPAAGDASAPDPATCHPDRPLPVVAFNGTADPVNPFAGGGAPYWGYSVLTAEQRWADLDGCRRARFRHVTQHVWLIQNTGCRQGVQVRQYVVDGGGHTWPGGDASAFPAALGPTTQEISANDLMWNYFRHIRLRHRVH